MSITDHDFDNFGGGGEGCYLDNFSSESGKIMICDKQTVLSRLKLFRDGPLSILVPISTGFFKF